VIQRKGRKIYLGAIHPCVGPETNGVAEGEEEDEDDACVI